MPIEICPRSGRHRIQRSMGGGSVTVASFESARLADLLDALLGEARALTKRCTPRCDSRRDPAQQAAFRVRGAQPPRFRDELLAGTFPTKIQSLFLPTIAELLGLDLIDRQHTVAWTFVLHLLETGELDRLTRRERDELRRWVRGVELRWWRRFVEAHGSDETGATPDPTLCPSCRWARQHVSWVHVDLGGPGCPFCALWSHESRK